MKVIQYKHKRNKLFFSILIIILLLLVLPQFFFTNIALISILFGIIILIASIYWKTSFSVLILAMSLTIPYAIGDDVLNTLIWWPINIIRIIIIFWFLYNRFILKKSNKAFDVKIIVCFISLLFISLIYSINNNNYTDLINWINTFIYFYLFFYIASNEEISIKDFFYLLDVIFILTFVYVIIEVFFFYTPYISLYLDEINNQNVYEGRARGLLGHPLILSSFLILYQSTLYFKLILYKKFHWILFIMTFIFGILTNSRTTILLMSIFVLYYFIINKIYKNPKKLLLLITILITGSTGIIYTMESLLLKVLERIHEDSLGHRQAAYGSTYNFFMDHILGVGYDGLTKKIVMGGYAEKGLIKDFGTLDNFFLTQIGAYGIFSLLVFYFYFYIFLKVYRIRKINKNVYHCFLMLFISWFFIGLSFDLNFFLCILLAYSSLFGILMKEYKNTLLTQTSIKYKNNYALNNNRQL